MVSLPIKGRWTSQRDQSTLASLVPSLPVLRRRPDQRGGSSGLKPIAEATFHPRAEFKREYFKRRVDFAI
jgi:hypothetical protein